MNKNLQAKIAPTQPNFSNSLLLDVIQLKRNTILGTFLNPVPPWRGGGGWVDARANLR